MNIKQIPKLSNRKAHKENIIKIKSLNSPLINTQKCITEVDKSFCNYSIINSQ